LCNEIEPAANLTPLYYAVQLGNTEMAALFTSYRGYHQRIKRQLELVRSIPPPPPPLPLPVLSNTLPAATEAVVTTVTVAEMPAVTPVERSVPAALSDRQSETMPMAAVVDVLADPGDATSVVAAAATAPVLP
jgi:hypothetical protein